MKKKILTISTYIIVYLFFFAVADILFSNFVYKKDVQSNCYKYTEYFHHLKKNCHAKEKWLKNSLSYNVYTDINGFRFSGKENKKKLNKIATFFGGSGTYGMGIEHEKTFVGLVENAKEEFKIINLGVAGYSTSVFHYQLKKLIDNKIYPNKIFVVLDVLDVSNEASLWDQKNGFNHPVKIKKNIIDKEDKQSLKSFKKKNFKGSRLIARSINNFFRSIRLYFSTLKDTSEKSIKTPWGSFLYTELKDTEKWLWEPFGFDQGILKVTENINKISKLSKSINAEFYLIIYPWPDALEYGQDNFNWEVFANDLCSNVSCTKLINLFSDFKNIKENSKNWTSKIYIKDDMHLREFGHKIVAKKILNVGFN
tara:strand:+ start:2203 stop:3303 length:1101 start_codon:yes stop_codon:yes gene_type:complete